MKGVLQDAIQRLSQYTRVPRCRHETSVIVHPDRGLQGSLPVLEQWAARSVRLPAPPPPPACQEMQQFLARTQASLAESAQARTYLTLRGIPLTVAQATGLGFASRGTWPHSRGQAQPRIVAPLTTLDGTLLTLYGRSVVSCDNGLRHDFLPGPRGIFHAPALTEDGLMLVEGVFDAF